MPADVAVSTREGGVDTGLEVTPGQRLRIKAAGVVQYGYEGGATGDCKGMAWTDANGTRTVDDRPCATKHDDLVPLPSAPVGALIGRIGDGPWFMIGADNFVACNRAGELWLAHNDDTPQDNAGSFQVEIERGQ